MVRGYILLFLMILSLITLFFIPGMIHQNDVTDAPVVTEELPIFDVPPAIEKRVRHLDTSEWKDKSSEEGGI